MLPFGAHEKSVLVVAHPDDEALWFSGVLPEVERLVVCYAAATEQVRQGAPFANATFLWHPTFGGYHPRHFAWPIRTRHGLLTFRSWRSARRYRDNYRLLRAELADLVPAGSNVFTHSPWGEYGHEEHIQVNQVIAELATERPLSVWHTNYASYKTFPMLRQHLFAGAVDSFSRPIDPALTARLKAFYEARQAWTWMPDWEWFPTEVYFRQPPRQPARKGQHVLPMNLFNLRY